MADTPIESYTLLYTFVIHKYFIFELKSWRILPQHKSYMRNPMIDNRTNIENIHASNIQIGAKKAHPKIKNVLKALSKRLSFSNGNTNTHKRIFIFSFCAYTYVGGGGEKEYFFVCNILFQRFRRD